VTVQVDSRERKNKHVTEAFDRVGVEWFVSKLPVADYMSLDFPRLCVERKHNLEEVTGNMCQQHERFRAELLRAEKIGIQIIMLVEHSDSIKTLGDVRHWINPRLAVSKYALSGFELYRRLVSVSTRYNLPIYFCEPKQTGATIIDILQHPSNYMNLGGK
jgi:hypothetical protein